MNRVCSYCDSDKTYLNNRGYKLWHKQNDNWYCQKCYNKLFHGPKYNPINNPVNTKKRIWLRKKRIVLKEDPRIGICQWCGAVRGITCKRTHMHHIEYHHDPLKDTVELCVSCHAKTRVGTKYKKH